MHAMTEADRGAASGALKIALFVPCHDEDAAIGPFIADFARHLPEAECHVFDNASGDATATVARAAGARVHHVALRGKGSVARRASADLDAGVLGRADGDATCGPAGAAR